METVHHPALDRAGCVPASPTGRTDPHIGWEAERVRLLAKGLTVSNAAKGGCKAVRMFADHESDCWHKAAWVMEDYISSTEAQTFEGLLIQAKQLSEDFENDTLKYEKASELARNIVATIKRLAVAS